MDQNSGILNLLQQMAGFFQQPNAGQQLGQSFQQAQQQGGVSPQQLQQAVQQQMPMQQPQQQQPQVSLLDFLKFLGGQ